MGTLNHITATLCFLTLSIAPATWAWAQRSPSGEPLAEVNGVPITTQDVEAPIASQLGKLEEQIYNLKRQRVEALINERLLAVEAAKRKLAVAALLDAEVTAKVGLVTEQEIDKAYEANKGKFKGEEAQIKEQLRAALQNQKLALRRQEFLTALRSEAKIVVSLKPPPVLRAQVGTEGVATKGDSKAPVTIVEFTDFHCPFCKRVLNSLAEIEAKYAGKIRLVFRDFPIDQLHPAARKAHEAARCANDQGKFWAYHDKLFASAPRASIDNLKSYAKEVGMDVAAFDKCLSSAKYQAAVQKDIDEGTRLGVTGTPSFFINGRLLVGAAPVENFIRVIDEELAAK